MKISRQQEGGQKEYCAWRDINSAMHGREFSAGRRWQKLLRGGKLLKKKNRRKSPQGERGSAKGSARSLNRGASSPKRTLTKTKMKKKRWSKLAPDGSPADTLGGRSKELRDGGAAVG